MQNAASYTRECGTKQLHAPDRHIESWRLYSPVAPTSVLNSSHMDGIPTSNADRKMLGLPRTRGLIFYQSDYDKVKNLVYENFLPALNEETVGWSMPSYCNLTLQPANGTPNSLCQGFKTTQYDARKAKLHINVHSEEFETECYNTDQAAALTVCDQTHSISEDFLTAGSGRKIEEIAILNGISLQTASTKPSFEWSNVITEETAPRDLHQAFARQMDDCKESPPTEYKRTTSAFDGDQTSPSKRIRTSDALLKVQVRVRKEKLGERITALQQLVSPFGKTDTASVLLETIGYIKFLQDQVQVLSMPYVKGFASSQIQDGRAGDSEISELRRRGLCVMPLSCTQLVSNNNGAVFWASGIGDGPRV